MQPHFLGPALSTVANCEGQQESCLTVVVMDGPLLSSGSDRYTIEFITGAGPSGDSVTKPNEVATHPGLAVSFLEPLLTPEARRATGDSHLLLPLRSASPSSSPRARSYATSDARRLAARRISADGGNAGRSHTNPTPGGDDTPSTSPGGRLPPAHQPHGILKVESFEPGRDRAPVLPAAAGGNSARARTSSTGGTSASGTSPPKDASSVHITEQPNQLGELALAARRRMEQDEMRRVRANAEAARRLRDIEEQARRRAVAMPRPPRWSLTGLAAGDNAVLPHSDGADWAEQRKPLLEARDRGTSNPARRDQIELAALVAPQQHQRRTSAAGGAAAAARAALPEVVS